MTRTSDRFLCTGIGLAMVAAMVAAPSASEAAPPFTTTGVYLVPRDNGMQQSAVDSKGHLHTVVYTGGSNNNQTPDDIRVGLYSPDGAGDYAISVDVTVIASHDGYDDRHSTMVIVPSVGATDTTLIFNGTRNGHAFLTELDFGAAARDGSASDSTTLVKNTYFIPLSLSVQHPHMVLGGNGNLHISFVGSSVLGGSHGFSQNRVDRGVYYLRLSQTGEVLTGPVELYRSSPPNHPHTHPRLDVDGDGNVHGVFRAGSCGWSRGNVGCYLYYFKMSEAGDPLIVTTEIAISPGYAFDKFPTLGVGPNGNVNIVYSAYQGPRQQGASYDFGRGIYLHVISSVGNKITTLLNNLELVAPVGSDGPVNYKMPGLAVDAGGNLHISSHQDNGNRVDHYWIFDPKGQRRFGPFETSENGVHDDKGRSPTSLSILDSRVFLAGLNDNNTVDVTSFDFAAVGLDMTGGGQIPPPTLVAPSLDAITPATTVVGTPQLVVTLEGDGFDDDVVASVGGVALSGLVRYDANHLVGTLNTASLEPGTYDVVAMNTGGSDTLVAAFEVEAAPDDEQPDPDNGGCACRTTRSAPSAGSLALLALVALTLLRRRRA